MNGKTGYQDWIPDRRVMSAAPGMTGLSSRWTSAPASPGLSVIPGAAIP